MKINNVNVTRLETTIEEFKWDLTKAKKVNRIEGEWNTGHPLEESWSGSQFSAAVQFEGGKLTLEADQPAFLGGGGTQPGPMIYCLYGSASCYAATFAAIAAMEGIRIKKLKVVAESSVDFSKVFGLTENPIVEKVKFTLHVSSDAPPQKIKELEGLAKKRCPALYCLTNPIPVETEAA